MLIFRIIWVSKLNLIFLINKALYNLYDFLDKNYHVDSTLLKNILGFKDIKDKE